VGREFAKRKDGSNRAEASGLSVANCLVTCKRVKLAVNWSHLPSHRFRGNELRLWLNVIACNSGNFWVRLALPKMIGNWSLTSLQQRLVKTGGRVVKHVRYFGLLLAEGLLTRQSFGSILRRITVLPVPNE
jgi:hypothetical protein